MKYAVITFGCRVNQADSLAIEERLRAQGATDAPAEHADLLVVNTCSVTASADQGARQTIRRVVRNDDKDAAFTSNFELQTSNFGDGPCGRALEPGVAGRTALTLRVQTGCE